MTKKELHQATTTFLKALKQADEAYQEAIAPAKKARTALKALALRVYEQAVRNYNDI